MEMQNPKLAGSKPLVSTQKYLDISEIKENTIVLKDGSLRGILAISSTNFSLKSEDEQNAIISGYQSYLNSLDFPIQILIHSRVLDINGYLERLRGLMAGQTNELLRIQMSEYIEYIQKLVEYASIMSKSFYVVVPYSATPVNETWGSKLSRIFNPAGTIATSQESFERAKVKLDERVNHVAGGLGSMGLRALVLNTEELIELIYASYNFEYVAGITADEVEAASMEGVSIS